MEGRTEELANRAVMALERLAGANEEIIRLANEEPIVENGPPVCPHCGKLNPSVTQLNAGGSGPLNDFQLVGETHCCNRQVYCVPVAIVAFPKQEMANDAKFQMGGSNDDHS